MQRPLRVDLAGKQFGRLKVVGFSHRDKQGRAMWKCQCECGKATIVEGYNLSSGHTRSCVCLQSETTIKRSMTHGKTPRGNWHPLYMRFAGMKSRCYNKNSHKYRIYGARGIKVLWNSFEEFLVDMELDFWLHVSRFGAKNTSIDRIDVNDHYSKKNCRWATWKEQRNNQRILT